MMSADLTPFVKPHMKQDMPRAFFIVPDWCPAVFSTKNGSIQKRRLPDSPSPPLAHSDLNEAIRNKAKQLRARFPAVVRSVCHPPTLWCDLYKYFDAVDLWHEGPPFLFYVMNHISRENKVLDQESDDAKLAEIRKWAMAWMDAHGPHIAHVPIAQDLITHFDASEMSCIRGMEKRDIATLRNELWSCRKQFVAAQPPVDGPRLYVPPHSAQHQSAQAQSFIPGQQLLYHGQPNMRGPPIHTGPPIGPRGHQMLPEEAHRSPSMSMQSAHPMQPHPAHVTGFNAFMGARGNITASSHPVPNDSYPQMDRRQRGYSNDTFRHGRGGRGNYSNLPPQNRTVQPLDRRVVSNDATPRGSPLRRVSQLVQVKEGSGAVYVHNPQRQSPPFEGDATPRASGMQYRNQRNFTEPSNGQSLFSNDARLYNPDVEQPRIDSRPQPTGVSVPFENDPKACISRFPQSMERCTYWYIGDAKNTYPEQKLRTVFVAGFEREHFETHALKNVLAQCGEVESISYLVKETAQPSSRSPIAFVAYMSEASCEKAIQELNGTTMGNSKLLVNVTNNRDRSESIASQKFQDSNFTGPRDAQRSRRGYIRHGSVSYRHPSYSGSMDDRYQVPFKSSGEPVSMVNTLTEGFQAQLHTGQQIPMTNAASDALESTIAEVVQHNAALGRFSCTTHNLGAESYAGALSRGHTRNMSAQFSDGNDQSRTVMSQGSYSRKEITPHKKHSAKNTPYTSPKKDSPRRKGGDGNQKNHDSKNKKNENNPVLPHRPSSVPSPEKPTFEEMVIASFAEEQQIGDRSAAPKSQSPTHSSPLVEAKDAKVPEVHDRLQTSPGLMSPVIDSNNLEANNLAIVVEKSADPVVQTEPIIEQEATPTSEGVIFDADVHDYNGLGIQVAHFKKSSSPVLPGDSFPDILEEPTFHKSKKAKNKKNKSKKNKEQKPDDAIETEQFNTSDVSQDSPDQSTEIFVSALSSPNPSMGSGPSEATGCMTGFVKSSPTVEATTSPLPDKRNHNTKQTNPDNRPSSGVTSNSKYISTSKSSKKRRDNHSKKESGSSTVSNGSVRKTDIHSTKSGDKKDGTSKNGGGGKSSQSQKENQISSPIVNADDASQWPSLNSGKGPSVGAGNKSPVTPQPLVERKRNPNGAIVPAVPFSFQQCGHTS